MDQFVGKPRLPKFAFPKRYDIRLKPDLVACTFAGTVSVSLDVIEPTCFLVLNSADLSVHNSSVSFTSSSSEVDRSFFFCYLFYGWIGFCLWVAAKLRAWTEFGFEFFFFFFEVLGGFDRDDFVARLWPEETGVLWLPHFFVKLI
ncbi:hypothetical protein MLD38_006993 [Melastoma candidum]|uniref:Uncharacterized protein n=1 Tax=Melastoma candidum TaxID=119954 RepID=A0ACB9RQX4_9MYRT|nr:hypothetical protein MLD38_006993 [Melastoma candidum]